MSERKLVTMLGATLEQSEATIEQLALPTGVTVEQAVSDMAVAFVRSVHDGDVQGWYFHPNRALVEAKAVEVRALSPRFLVDVHRFLKAETWTTSPPAIEGAYWGLSVDDGDPALVEVWHNRDHSKLMAHQPGSSWETDALDLSAFRAWMRIERPVTLPEAPHV